MPVSIYYGGGTQFFDDSGNPLAGGSIDVYSPGTTTPIDSYKESSLTTPHTNPIVLDAYGRPPGGQIWFSGNVKTVVKTSGGVTVNGIGGDNLNPDQASAGTTTAPINYVVNGSFQIAQRGTSFTSTTTPANTDDNYLIDQWIYLSDGADVFDITQETSVARLEPGCFNGITFDVETANSKGGMLHVIDAKKTAALFKNATGTCSLSFTARAQNAGFDRIRAAVIAWTGTADAVTSDIVSAWNAEGTNPSLVASWGYENTPVTLTTLTSTPQRFEIENILLDTSNTTNIGIFIWMDETSNTVTNLITVSAVQLEPTATASAYVQPPYSLELWNCLEYLHRRTRITSSEGVLIQTCLSTTQAYGTYDHPREMRAAPTFSNSTASELEVADGGGLGVTLTAIAGSIITKNTTAITTTVAAGLTIRDAVILRFRSTANTFLQWSAEL